MAAPETRSARSRITPGTISSSGTSSTWAAHETVQVRKNRQEQ